ncbi:hypothetical protein CJ030_MR3G015501 [Morella rubra]|uniref:Uncharacterized protein n=1 Tax=Morella rubra TaxID=262757 RepID=A0A6A1WAM6_9ROSI|nr:hypothetical protein CJ030_MR3G015501 [Morella rubra]
MVQQNLDQGASKEKMHNSFRLILAEWPEKKICRESVNQEIHFPTNRHSPDCQFLKNKLEAGLKFEGPELLPIKRGPRRTAKATRNLVKLKGRLNRKITIIFKRPSKRVDMSVDKGLNIENSATTLRREQIINNGSILEMSGGEK